MKKFFLITLILLTSLIGYSQECSKFYPLREGVKIEYTTYDKKGKEASVVEGKITEVKEVDGNKVATFSSDVETVKKGETMNMTYDMTCDGDKLSIDFQSMMNSQMMKQYEDMEVEVTGTNIDLPNNLKVGDDLADASMNIEVSMAGIPMKISTDITERKVVGKESVTTTAGTYECFIIEYNIKLKMGMARQMKSKQWISEGVGLVKQEDYNNNGKVTSSTVLTAFSE